MRSMTASVTSTGESVPARYWATSSTAVRSGSSVIGPPLSRLGRFEPAVDRSPAAVHGEHRAGDERRSVRSEVHDSAGQLVGTRPTPESALRCVRVVPLRARLDLRGQRRFDDAGRDGVDPDAGRPELGRGRPEKLHQSGFRGRIRSLAGLDGGAADRRKADDAPPASGSHPSAKSTHDVEGGTEVQRDDAVEFLARVVEQTLAYVHRGGQHDDVERAQLGRGMLDGTWLK